MDAQTRAAVWHRARGRCEYCKIDFRAWDVFEFHVEHIYAKKHGGSDDLQNLCLSCPECNWAKGTDLSGLVDGKIVPLFHPRRQVWTRHFVWDSAILVGRTLCGRATLYVLNINDPERIQMRQSLLDEGRLPQLD